MRISWMRLALLAASCLYAGTAAAQNLNLTNHTTRFILLQTEDSPCTNPTASVTPTLPSASCAIGANDADATYTDLTNDYYGTLSFVGTSALPNGTGGTNTWQVSIDPVTWGRTIAPIVSAGGAVLSTATGVTVLFDQDTGALANPAGPTAPSYTAALVYQPGTLNIPLTLTGLPDASDEPFFGTPAAVGTTKPGPPLGPRLVFSCAWGKANPTASSQGVDYPGTGVCPEPYPNAPGFATGSGGGSYPGTSLTAFSQDTIFITGAAAPEAAAAFAALKWRMQEMPQTDTDGDGVPDPPSGYFTGANHNYPVKGYFDNCPYAANANQKDSVGNGIGDACRCGDVTNDGLINATDKTILSRSLAGLGPYGSVTGMPGFNKCDTNGDTLCNTVDKTVLSRFLANLPPGIAQQCPAAIP